MAAPTIYCIDTSPGLQDRIEELIKTGRLRAPKAVLDEIKPGDDCHKWAQAQTELFVEESVAVQQIVRDLMATHHDPAKPHKGISGADPFVVAMAKDGGAPWKVVADEHPGSQENRKIPFVCKHEGLSCVTLQEMMLAEGWKF